MTKKGVNIHEEVTQAVIFAQSFDPNFGPLSITKPKILLPLVNRPMLAYSLEMLSRSNIQEVFVFCNQNLKEIQVVINDFIANSSNKDMNIQLFVRDEYENLGSSIRDLDSKGFIKNNFVLIYGDCVGNLNLKEMLELHKENMKKDPGCVMTNIYRRTQPDHRIRNNNEEPVLVLDDAGKIIFYDNSRDKTQHLPKELLEEMDCELHFDLVDTFVSICSNKVPPDFSDNFDYESRDDFLHGMLASVDLLQHFIYAHIIDEGYGARVTNVSTYDAVSRDLIQRFVYPITPDSETGYRYRASNVFFYNRINFADKSKYKQNLVVGNETTIGNGCFISESVIGDNCKIGTNVNIQDSYIWNNAVIEDGCIIRKSIIASDVTIKAGTTVDSGCIIAENVVLAKDLTKNMYVINDADNDIEKDAVGETGCGQAFRIEADNSDNEDEILDYWGRTKDVDDDSTSLSTDLSEEEFDDPDDHLLDEFKPFFDEVHESLLRGVEEKLLAENLILEINSSKHAYNVPIKVVNTLVMKAVLNLSEASKKDYLQNTVKHLKYGLPIIQNYIRTVESQTDGIYSIEEYFLENEDQLQPMVFVKIVQFLYNEDIFEEDVILKWFNSPNVLEDFDVEDQQRLRKQRECQMFLKWLNEAEEESSEEDSE